MKLADAKAATPLPSEESLLLTRAHQEVSPESRGLRSLRTREVLGLAADSVFWGIQAGDDVGMLAWYVPRGCAEYQSHPEHQTKVLSVRNGATETQSHVSRRALLQVHNATYSGRDMTTDWNVSWWKYLTRLVARTATNLTRPWLVELRRI